MLRNPIAVFIRTAGVMLGLALVSMCASAQTAPAYVYSSALLPRILQMPENSWARVNVNAYSDVWTPPDLEPLDADGVTHTPQKIIRAWSGFAWDSNRGDIILYGGGHANYSGNDVYRWHAGNLAWERASLPSDVYSGPQTYFTPIDGVDNAPGSAHTYKNNTFLPIVDRFLTFGGAAYNNGHEYLRISESNPSLTRPVGPYLFDPNRANGNKVGGTTGSHVKRVAPHPEIVGGNMWQNRDMWKYFAGQNLPGRHVNGCAAYAAEGGRDVVYAAAFTGVNGTALNLYRYQVTDVTNPALDQISQVGMYSVGTSGQTTCGYDPARKLFVRTGTNSTPFLFWDLTTAGPNNPDKLVQVDSTIASLQSWLAAQSLDIQMCALERDPNSGTYLLWCGGSNIWELTPPPTNTVSGWSIRMKPAPAGAAPVVDPTTTGILGKWRYAPFFDAFVGLENPDEGHVWIYKPTGWVQPNPPGNALPTVSILTPSSGSSYAPGDTVALTASASDADGNIARVEYYVNGAKVGQATAAPFSVTYSPIKVGSYGVVAVAVDNVGGMRASAQVNFTVNATLTTVVLQRGLNGYAGVTDTYLDPGAPTTPHGTSDPLYSNLGTYVPLLRFAVFQQDGGPVPTGAILQSATLELYKQYYDDTLGIHALLKPWNDAQATWNVAQTGSAWSTPGAGNAGADYVATPDDVIDVGFNPGWVAFDVTNRVQQWSGSSGANNGWRLLSSGTTYNNRTFNSSEYAANATLRPKLTLVYSVPSTTFTASIATPASGASITFGGSFALTATTTDTGGTVTSVAYKANGVPIGSATTAPYAVSWTPTATGTYSLTAVATDTRGATANAAPVTVTVNAASSGTTLVLQRGLNGYAGVADTYLDPYNVDFSRGAYDPLFLNAGTYVPLVRFAIFQPEGGSIPAGATIQSATLSLYKQYYDDTIRLNAVLKPWVENQATWNVARTGAPWTVAGAGGSGTDYDPTTDALVAAGFDPGWVSFDVSARVRQWSSGAATNNGWRLTSTGSNYGNKTFDASEYASNSTLRPKLTIVYTQSTVSVVLQRGLNGYAGATDTYLDPYVPTTVRGAANPLYLNANSYVPLVRFAVLQSEGGPVPAGATIVSATLSLYKQYYDDTIRLNALLKPWGESQATWNLARTGVSWALPGAGGSGTDYDPSADALINAGFNPGWVDFDVSARVQQWASGAATNNGWRLTSTGTNYGNKTFNSAEFTSDPSLRPKLTIVYR